MLDTIYYIYTILATLSVFVVIYRYIILSLHIQNYLTWSVLFDGGLRSGFVSIKYIESCTEFGSIHNTNEWGIEYYQHQQ